MEQVHPTQTQEDDIAAVIGRFHAWNNGRENLTVQSEGSPDPAQEITYEEALAVRKVNRLPVKIAALQPAATESRGHAASTERVTSQTIPALDPVTVKVRSASAATQGPHHAEKMPALKPVVNAAVHSKMAGPLKAASGVARNSVGKSPAAPMQGIAAKATRSSATAIETKSEKGSARRATPSTSTKTSRKLSASAEVSTRSLVGRQHTSRRSETSAVAATPTKAETTRTWKPRAEAKATVAPTREKKVSHVAGSGSPAEVNTFRAVFEKKLASDTRKTENRVAKNTAGSTRELDPISASDMRYAVSEAKSIAMKLRVSAVEHAQIKAGADEAGVTLAAYMRQCTLDVKVLRELLTRTIYDLKAPVQAPLSAKDSASLDLAPIAGATENEPVGFLARIKKRWNARRLESRA